MQNHQFCEFEGFPIHEAHFGQILELVVRTETEMN